MMKVYSGTRDFAGAGCHVQIDERGESRDLPPRNDLRNHSPGGFEWGYGGSGPAQLALAILADCLGDDELAQSYYQDFKFSVIGRLPQVGWLLTEADVRKAFLISKSRRRNTRSPNAVV